MSAIEHHAAGDRVAILTLLGEHDVATCDAVRRQLLGLIAAGRPVVVDLQPALFVDSSIIGALLLGVREAEGRGVPLAMALSPERNAPVHATLALAGLLDALPIHASRADAVAAAAPELAEP